MSPFAQDLIALGMGLAALVYLCRRWWPSVQALFKPATGSQSQGCGQSDSSSSPACGSGCGGCGSTPRRPAKDHRIQVVKRQTSAR